MVLRASQRATELIREIAGGTPAKEIQTAGKLPANPADVSLKYEKCDRVLGIPIKPKQIDEILIGFGLKKTSAAKTTKWKVPSYRRDLQRDVDLIEEVVRAYGAEKIPGTDRSRFTPSSAADDWHDLESALRDGLTACGFVEVRTSKLIPRSATAATTGNAIKLRNPLSEDHVALRPDLLPGLVAVLDRNVRTGAERVAIFELGRVFVPPTGKEERHLGILLWGNAAAAPHWRVQANRRLDFFDLKGTIESLQIKSLSFRRSEHRDFALATEILSRERVVGLGGQLSASCASELDAAGPVFFVELDADLLLEEQKAAKTFREIERFPAVTRDIAMIVPDKLSHAEISRTIEEPREPFLESAELFDLFEGQEGLATGAFGKSLAYRLTYRAKNRTLTNEEVTDAHAKIRERLKRELGVTLRE
jgi:phenylalanyl-tRNA synthetase beta chain